MSGWLKLVLCQLGSAKKSAREERFGVPAVDRKRPLGATTDKPKSSGRVWLPGSLDQCLAFREINPGPGLIRRTVLCWGARLILHHPSLNALLGRAT